VSRELAKLMKIPIDNYNNLITVLKLAHFAPLIEYFDFYGRKDLSAYLVTNALENETLVPSQEQVDSVLNIIDSMIQDQTDQPSSEEDPDDFAEEQGLLGR
jgi:vacuolar protein sorting-associated protein 35